MMPATYIFSGLYLISPGKFKHAMEMIPQDVLAPRIFSPSGLKKSTKRAKA
jgi:hypothetical protein